MATLTLRTGVYLGKVGKRTSMHTDQKWKWAGIVSVVQRNGLNPDRSNFDGAGTVGGADLSLWAGVFVAGKSASSSATLCP